MGGVPSGTSPAGQSTRTPKLSGLVEHPQGTQTVMPWGRQLLEYDGTEDQDTKLFLVIVGVSLLNIFGSGFSILILSFVKKYYNEYSSKLLRSIVVTCILISFTMIVTPSGYDSSKTELPETGQCEWQAFAFVVCSEARWLFTGIMFMSEMRKVVSDKWPSRNFIKHRIWGWGYPLLLGAGGWIWTRKGDEPVYGWQYSGRCGVVTSTDAGAIFLAVKVGVDLVIVTIICRTMWVVMRFLIAKEEMRAHSADRGIMGMWLNSHYEEVYLRHSLYFRIGLLGLLVKIISLMFEIALVVQQLGGTKTDKLQGQGPVVPKR